MNRPPKLFGRRAWLAAATALAACSAASAQDEGFTPLFDGTLDGWVIEGADDGSFITGEHVLRIAGDHGWLRSEQTYSDFSLRIEFRWLTDDADSGVYVRAANDGEFMNDWPNGSYQVQLRNPELESRFPPVGGLFRHGLPDGAIIFDPAQAARQSRPIGEWQTMQIDAIGDRLAVTLNGAPVMQAEGIVRPEGYIGFQSEMGALEIRWVEIDDLSAP
jgi:hypothetical protein